MNTQKLNLHNEEIHELLTAMDIAQTRHENTNYDELRELGLNKEDARKFMS